MSIRLCDTPVVVAVALQPTGENGATRAPIVVDLARDPGLSSKSIVLQIDSKSQQVSASKLDLVAVLPASIDEFWELGDYT